MVSGNSPCVSAAPRLKRAGYRKFMISHVEVEVVAGGRPAAFEESTSTGLESSITDGKVGSALCRGGELLGKLAVERVGELVDCDCASGGVPVEWDCASFARRLV